MAGRNRRQPPEVGTEDEPHEWVIGGPDDQFSALTNKLLGPRTANPHHDPAPKPSPPPFAGAYRPEDRHRVAPHKRDGANPIWIWVLFLAAILLFSVAIVQVTTGFTSPDLALRHIVAAGGCDFAAGANLAAARRGEPGYWTWLDRDGNGIACELPPVEPEQERLAGGKSAR